MKINLRKFFATKILILLTLVSIYPATAKGEQIAEPKASYVWSIEEGVGIVNCQITVPSTYFAFWSEGEALPSDMRLRLVVTRSCKALGEEEIEIVRVGGLTPGQTLNRTDNADPAWQYGFEYSYTAYVEDESGEGGKSVTTNSTLKPGYKFEKLYFDDNGPEAAEDLSYVTIKATVPRVYLDVNNQKVNLPENYFSAFKLYHQTTAPTPADKAVETIDNPTCGQQYTFITTDIYFNQTNTWFIVAEGPLGNAVSISRKLYVGYEAPGRINVTGTQNGRSVDLTWTAPTAGEDGGVMGPSPIQYNVYRSWGYGEDNRKLIAGAISETSYTDAGEDMDKAMNVNYLVVPLNEIGEGFDLSYANGTNYSNAPFTTGPDCALPFTETFMKTPGSSISTQQPWQIDNTKPIWTFGRPAPTAYSYSSTKIQPIETYKTENIAYVRFDMGPYPTESVKETNMTSWYIDIKSVDKPELSFYYYRLPDTDAKLEVQQSDGMSDFQTVKTLNINEGIDETYDIEDKEANWVPVIIDLTPYKTQDGFKLRFKASYAEKVGTVMLLHPSIESRTQSGIDTITSDNADDTIDVYSITGIKVAQGNAAEALQTLPKGIYIVRSASSSRKVIVK